MSFWPTVPSPPMWIPSFWMTFLAGKFEGSENQLPSVWIWAWRKNKKANSSTAIADVLRSGGKVKDGFSYFRPKQIHIGIAASYILIRKKINMASKQKSKQRTVSITKISKKLKKNQKSGSRPFCRQPIDLAYLCCRCVLVLVWN